MALTAGTPLGPYEIIAPLGAGGMGEVYRARDTRLDRTVAIKILPEHLSSDPQRRMRFQREASTISGLSHPNVCALYDVGEQSGIHFLVLEYLEGQSLADRLQKGALPVAETLKIGMEIAAGLDAAHRRGVVHRDLKPANVILTKTGAKIVDFGLAKPAHALGAAAVGDSPTLSKSLTEEGVILGTFQYMAPEQLEAKEADARTDIFALGVVLYEMATGQAAFRGGSRASLIAAILSSEPAPMSQVQPIAPPALEYVVQTCLAKDPEQRFQSAHDVLVALKWIGSGSTQQVIAESVGKRSRWAWPVIAVLAIAALAGWLWPRKAPLQLPVLRATYPPPAGHVYSMSEVNPGAMTVVSPDGSKVAFECLDVTAGVESLWILDLSTGQEQSLPGSEKAESPFWSPDSKSVGFIRSGEVVRIDLESKAPSIIARVSGVYIGASWSSKGTIVLTADNRIFAVSAAGGELTLVLNDTGAAVDGFPWFLPDGRHFLVYRGIPGRLGFYVLDLKSADQKFLNLAPDSSLVYADPGYVLFASVGELRAQRFDAGTLQLTGEPITIYPKIEGNYPNTTFSASNNGIVEFFSGENFNYKLGWWSRDGKANASFTLPTDTGFSFGGMPRISPDAASAALSLGHSQRVEQWVLNLKRETWTRLTTSDAGTAMDSTWSPDSRQVAFGFQRPKDRDPNVAVKNASGLGEQENFLSPYSIPTDWTKSYFVYDQHDGVSKSHIAYFDFASGKSKTLLGTSSYEYGGRLSPDAHWLAYVSDESGQAEIYVVSFPDPTSRVPISTGGGFQPVWSRDGHELFYVAADETLMSVPISISGTDLRAGKPVALFKTAVPCRDCLPQFDVSADGKRFLMVAVDNDRRREMTVISNWTALLKK